MKNVPWRMPLWVTLQNGMRRQFCSVYDALDFLEYEWPVHGPRHARAVQACRQALQYPQYSEAARNCFVAACIEASLAFSEMANCGCRADSTVVSRPK